MLMDAGRQRIRYASHPILPIKRVAMDLKPSDFVPARDRIKMEQTQDHIGPQSVEALADILEREKRRRQRSFWLTNVVLIGSYLLSCMLGDWYLRYVGTIRNLSSLQQLYRVQVFCSLQTALVVIGTLVWLGFAFYHKWYPSKREEAAIRQLATSEDPRAINSLWEALRFSKRGIRRAVLAALTSLFPRMENGNVAQLTKRNRADLYEVLRRGRSLVYGDAQQADLLVVALKGAAQLGDEAVMPVMERLAAQQANTEEQERIKQTAEECLLALRDRVTKAKLLRPARQPGEPDATLLRPASSVAESEADRLLRASIQEEQDNRTQN